MAGEKLTLDTSAMLKRPESIRQVRAMFADAGVTLPLHVSPAHLAIVDSNSLLICSVKDTHPLAAIMQASAIICAVNTIAGYEGYLDENEHMKWRDATEATGG